MNIGLKIKELTKEKNIDVVWLSTKLGMTKQAVYAIFNKEDVSTAIIKSLSQICEVPISYFFDDDSLPCANSTHVNGDNNFTVGRDNHGNIGRLADCKKEVKHLKDLLAEKERLIQVLLKK